MPSTQPPAILDVPAEDLCLAFVNTRYWRGSPVPTEELREPADVLHWLASAAPRAAALAAAPPDLGAAITLREMLHDLLAAVASGERPDPALLNRALAHARPRNELACDGAYGWAVEPAATSAEALLSPILWSAADLLAGPRLGRLRACANPQCGWLFLDDSKAANRRWCAMSACGNRAKARRHYARVKAARASEE
jgi:predicted RNA-binding Zn ribbon-like protein